MTDTLRLVGSTETLVSVNEYLNTSYEPDREFVEGALVERNVGTQLHGLLQTIVAAFFWQFRTSHRIHVFTETRLLMDATSGRYRIPDVLVLNTPYRKGKVVVDIPVIVIEIKSPDDTFDDIVDKCFEYEMLGVSNIVVMDPDNRRAWLFTKGNLQLLGGGSFEMNLSPQKSTIDFPFARMFAELDD